MVQPEVAGNVVLRDAHKQKTIIIEPVEDPENVQFIGFFEPTNIKFDKFGCLIVSITIPPEYIELGLELRRFTGCPLSVDIQKWRLAIEDEDNVRGDGG